jgi:hypothetical protein
MRSTLLVSVLLGALLQLPLRPLHAQPTDGDRKAEGLLRKATGLHASADFEEALRLLELARFTARDKVLRARIELDLAVNNEALGRIQAARDALRAALEHDPLLELHPGRFKASTIALFREVRGGLRGRIEITCEGRPCGTVWIDGVELGQAQRGALAIGRHHLVVHSSDGKATHDRRIVLGAGQLLRLHVRFPRPRGSLSVRSTPAGATVILDGKRIGRTPLVQGGLEVGPHVVTLRREGLVERTVPIEIADGAERQLEIWLPSPGRPVAPSARRRRWTWIVGGAAVVALGAGVGMGIAANATHRLWEEQLGVDRAEWEELRTSGQRKQLAANILLGVGGALAAASVALFVLEGREQARPVRKLQISARGAGLELRGSF